MATMNAKDGGLVKSGALARLENDDDLLCCCCQWKGRLFWGLDVLQMKGLTLPKSLFVPSPSLNCNSLMVLSNLDTQTSRVINDVRKS